MRRQALAAVRRWWWPALIRVAGAAVENALCIREMEMDTLRYYFMAKMKE